MPVEIDTLPWETLALREEVIPWDALRALADVAVESADVRQRLIDIHRMAYERWPRAEAGELVDWTDFSDSGVLAVFDLAASRLDDAARRQVGEALIRRVFDAGRWDDDFGLMDSTRVARRLGAPAVDPAIRQLAEGGYDQECWRSLHDVLDAAEVADEDTKRRVIELCRRELDTVPDPDDPWSPVWIPARILSRLGDLESLPRLERIYELNGSTDMKVVVDRLHGRVSKEEDDLEDWFHAQSVEEWLPKRIQQLRDWLDRADCDESDVECASADEWAGPGVTALDLLNPDMLDPLAGRQTDELNDQYVVSPIQRDGDRIGRNEPCPCGSGRKFKKCCGK